MNKKGFAATGILYTILVLFILIIAGLLTLLYSRNQLLYKIKKEISPDVTLVDNFVCQATDVQNPGQYTVGDAYLCDPGDGEEKTFYLIDSTDTEVMLWYTEEVAFSTIYDSCSTIDSHGVLFCDPGESVVDEVFADLGWTNVTISLPTYEQIYGIGNSTTIPSSFPSIFEAWLEVGSDSAYYVFENEIYAADCENAAIDTLGIMPVITIRKSDIKVD